jgi:Flp pilus assembly protein TadG
LRKVVNSTRGAAAIEFAIVLPLLLAIVFGIIEFGAVLYNQAVITNASREAARFSAAFYTNPANATATQPTCANIQDYVVNYVNTYFISFTSSSFNASNVTCPTGTPYTNYSGYAGIVSTIRIRYQYNFMLFGNLMGLLTGGTWAPSLTLTAQTAMRDENQGP